MDDKPENNTHKLYSVAIKITADLDNIKKLKLLFANEDFDDYSFCISPLCTNDNGSLPKGPAIQHMRFEDI